MIVLEVNDMAYKVENQKDKNEYWFIEMIDGEATGPAVCSFTDCSQRRIGVMKNSWFLLDLTIFDKEGTEYCLSKRGKEFKKDGPSLLVKNGVAFFGYFRNGQGFHGPVYVFEKGKKTKIQEYFEGALIKEGEYDFVFNDDLFINLPFDFVEDDKVSNKEFVGHDGSVTNLYTTGDKESSKIYLGVLQAQEYGTTIGQYRHSNRGFHGLTMKSIDEDDLVIFRKYENGSKNDDFQLTYSKQADGISFVSKNSDGTYTDFVFSLKDSKYKMSIAILNKNRKATNGFTFLPYRVKDIVAKKTFFLREETKVSGEDELNRLIGLESVKKQMQRIKAYCVKNKDKEKLNLSMIYTGNPGTGKTEVARLVAKILFENDILPSNKFTEVDRSGLIAEYVGQTESKVKEIVKEAMGGVLFIDEAYSLFSGFDNDYGHKVIDILTKELEDNRGKFCVIFAGYPEPMKRMINMNQGFKSRINRWVDFPNYSLEELKEIAKLMFNKSHYKCTKRALEEVMKIVKCKMGKEDFANGREVRNILESLYEIQSERTINDVNNVTITLDDVICYECENNIHIKEDKITRVWDVDALWHEMNIQEVLKTPFTFSNSYLEERTVSLKTEKGEGTGFFISPMGIIGTAAHVVKGSEKITAKVNVFTKLNEKITKEYEVEVIGLDEANDIAILGIVKRDITYPYFPLIQSDYLPHIGDEIAMGGYPFGESRFSEISINEGKVQSLNKDTYLKNGSEEVLRIYVDISGQPGNSGSAVIDKNNGCIIGIFSGASLNIGKYTVDEINYAIPVKPLWDLIYKYHTN